MKKFFTRFFVTLGVIFFFLLCGAGYLWFADPFEVRPLIDLMFGNTPSVASEAVTEADGEEVQATADKNPALNATQERALEVVGIDPANVPTTITPEQEACFVEKLGSARVEEIKAGGTPSATEIFTARSCIE